MSFQRYSESLRSRLRLGSLDPRLAIGIIVLMVIVTVIATLAIASSLDGGPEERADAEAFAIESAADVDEGGETAGTSAPGGDGSRSAQGEEICVYVSGRVASPGICYLPAGSRVADAIEAQGGFLEDASRDSLNLARTLQDGEHVIVPSEEEAEASKEGTVIASGEGHAAEGAGSIGASEGDKDREAGLVNINTASSDELQSLRGIGEAKAQRIIAYREENGAFSSVEELTNVSGIGQKTLESIRDGICV